MGRQGWGTRESVGRENQNRISSDASNSIIYNYPARPASQRAMSSSLPHISDAACRFFLARSHRDLSLVEGFQFASFPLLSSPLHSTPPLLTSPSCLHFKLVFHGRLCQLIRLDKTNPATLHQSAPYSLHLQAFCMRRRSSRSH